MNKKPLVLLLPLLCFSCAESKQSDESAEQTKAQAIQLRLASQSEGNVRTLSYQIYPVTSSQKVDLQLLFADGSDVSSCLTAVAEESTRTVTLTCQKAFSKEAKLTLYSSLDHRVQATASINYTKKLLGISSSASSWRTELTNGASFPESEPEKKAKEFYSPEFSEYSKVSNPSEEVVMKVEKAIIAPFKNGKYSKYGNIDQSSTTLRDCPVGAPLLSYFSNLYKSFSKEEKKAVNAFGRWGLYRYYKVTMSYNGASYEKAMLHVISFSVNALPGYDPTV